MPSHVLEGVSLANKGSVDSVLAVGGKRYVFFNANKAAEVEGWMGGDPASDGGSCLMEVGWVMLPHRSRGTSVTKKRRKERAEPSRRSEALKEGDLPEKIIHGHHLHK